MPTPDYFNSDAFNLISLTSSINKLPFMPGLIGQMGLFSEKPISTEVAVVEELDGQLSLLPSKPRGTPGTVHAADKRKVRSMNVPHIPYDGRVEAASVQGVRRFGSEDQAESVVQVVNDQLTRMRQNHEMTHEFLRIGAIKGLVLDGDGATTIYDLATLFGVSLPTAIDFVLGTDTTDITAKCTEVRHNIEDGLGNMPYTGIEALCSRSFMKKFVSHPDVKYAFQYVKPEFLTGQPAKEGFEFAGIRWREYRGSIGGTAFIPADDVRFFPTGVPDLFQEIIAPADFMETVNTLGVRVYAKQEAEDFNRGVALHTQSNVLPICTRPAVLQRGTTSN